MIGDGMTTTTRFFLIGVVLFLMITMPVTAAMNVTKLDDGRTMFSNGTYWITWDPVGEHVVGDKFFINATTNLSAGTKFVYNFLADSYDACHTKICNKKFIDITEGIVIVEPGNSFSPNTISILINTTSFKSDNYHFIFNIISSNYSKEYDAFSSPVYGIVNNPVSLQVTQTPIPTKSSLSFILTLGALGSAWIVIMIKRRVKFR